MNTPLSEAVSRPHPIWGEDGDTTPPAPRLLLVEDDEVDRLALQRHVTAQKLDYRLTSATSLAEARALLARESFDLLLLDQGLADGDGFELFTEVRDVPVVFLTGNTDLAHAVRAVRAGAADYLVKDHARRYLELLPHTVERALLEYRTRRDLRRVSELNARVFEEAAVGNLLLRSDGAVLRANQAACQLTGHSEAELRADGLKLFLPEGELEDCRRLLANVNPGQACFRVEKTCRHRDGSPRLVRFHVARLNQPAGQCFVCIVQMEDLTEARHLEEQQQLLSAQLNHARRLEAIGTLTGGIAHEFNNLLTSVFSNIQLADLDLTPEHPARLCLREAVSGCRRFREQIQRLMTFCRPADSSYQPVALHQVVHQTLELLRPELPANLTVEVDLAENCPPVLADIAEIREALWQIGQNAAQATGPGGRIQISLRRELPPEDFRLRHPQVRPGEQARLEVCDQGPGMDALTLAHIFEPFFTTRPPGQGAGLGLAGVYGIMRRHHGSVVVTSEVGKGTSVSLFFPLGEGSRGQAQLTA